MNFTAQPTTPRNSIRFIPLCDCAHPGTIAAISAEEIFESVPDAHRHDFYSLLWLSGADGRHVIDFQSHPFDSSVAGTLHCVAPGQVHRLERFDLPASGDAAPPPSGCGLLFSEDFLLEASVPEVHLRALLELRHAPVVAVEPALARRLNFLFAEMQAELRAGPTNNVSAARVPTPVITDHSRQFLAGALIAVLACIGRDLAVATSARRTGKSEIIDRFQNLIELNYLHRRRVRDYAELLSISPGYLNYCANLQGGKSASAMIRDRIVLEARRLLLHSSLSVADVADELNFDNATDFSRFFKRYGGQTAGEFRARHARRA